MKKLLITGLMLGTLGIFVPASAEAKTSKTAEAADPQIRVRIGNNRRRYRRSYTTTRITRVGRYRYRETIRVTYLPNGRTRTQVISRVRIGGRRW